MPSHEPRSFIYHLRLRQPAPWPDMPRHDMSWAIFLVSLDDSLGEACPSAHLGETIHETGQALETMLAGLSERRAEAPAAISAWLRDEFPMHPSARAALEMLAYDQAARRQGQPLYESLRLPSPAGLASSYPLALSSEAEIEPRLAEARDFAAFKVKCTGNLENDLALLQWLGRQTGQALRIDAGGGWTFEEARRGLPKLARLNIEYLEQPLMPHGLEETAALMRVCPFPIYLEACGTGTLDHLVGCCNGVIVRLMTCGGFTEMLRLIRRCRELGLQVGLETTLESSAGLTAAGHLAAAVDAVNLGHQLLIENDPIEGLTLSGGRIRLPQGPGLALTFRQEYLECFRQPYPR